MALPTFVRGYAPGPGRRRFRAGYLADGTRLTWEYPRESPDGDQLDLVEVMEVRNRLIQHHRVHRRWYAVGLLRAGRHP